MSFDEDDSVAIVPMHWIKFNVKRETQLELFYPGALQCRNYARNSVMADTEKWSAFQIEIMKAGCKCLFYL